MPDTSLAKYLMSIYLHLGTTQLKIPSLMSFHHLPSELTCLILGHCGRPADVTSLMLTCRALSVLARPLLYENVEPRHLQFLARTFLHRPELGALVKHLCLRESSLRGLPKIFKTDLDNLMEKCSEVMQMSSTYHAAWLDLFRNNDTLLKSNRSLLTVFVLSCCENLQSLNLERWFCYAPAPKTGGGPLPGRRSRVSKTWSSHYLSFTALQNPSCLKAIELVPSAEPEDTFDIELIAEIFLLPGLESLTLTVCEAMEHYDHRFLLQATAPLLTSLDLRDVKASERAVGTLLQPAPNLKSLRISILRDVAPQIRTGSNTFLDCAALMANIAHFHAGSDISAVHLMRNKHLEHLAITTAFFSSRALEISNGGAFECGRDGNGDGIVNWGIKSSLGSLKEFTSLRTLEVPIPVLLGWYVHRARPLGELLPDGLAELRLRADLSHWGLFKWNVKAVVELLGTYVAGEYHGSLKTVKYMLLDEDITDNEKLLHEMKEKCNTAGIRFETVRVDDPDEQE